MERKIVGLGVLVVMLGVCAGAWATPAVDSAVIHDRVFNDFPGSTFSSINLYPAHIQLMDQNVGTPPPGFANLHNFRLSDNGGVSDAVFNNPAVFDFAMDVTLSGGGNMEGGMSISPWWSKQVDGRINMRTTDGEVAVFGGRLPFYSFTGNHIDPNTGLGLRYAKGTTVRLGAVYRPNGLSMADPGTIQYSYELYDPDGAGPDVGYTFTSPVLAFDEGNPTEDPPYGRWGILNDARVGGFVQIFGSAPPNDATADFENLTYVPEPATALLISLAGFALIRRRR